MRVSVAARMAFLAGIAVFLMITPGFAQLPGSIWVSSTPDGYGCEIVDVCTLVQVHIVHLHTDGVRGSRFMLEPVMGWTHLGDVPDFPSLGTSISGMIVCMPSCMPSPVHLVTVNFFGSCAPPCTQIQIQPDPAAPSGLIEALDCNWNLMFPTGGAAVVNNDGGCPCIAGLSTDTATVPSDHRRKVALSKSSAAHFCTPVPVESSTWGAIKSMYQ